MSVIEPTTFGVSDSTHAKLKRLKEDGHFREMAEAYRFAIALALAQGIDPPDLVSSQTVFSTATIDPDQILKNAIQAINAEQVKNVSTYRYAERLADWGINELDRMVKSGGIDFAAIFNQLKEANRE